MRYDEPRLVWTSLTLTRWFNSLSATETLRKVLEDGRQDGLRDTLLRGPKTVIVQLMITNNQTGPTLVYLLLFITAVPNTKLCAWGEEDSGGHVL